MKKSTRHSRALRGAIGIALAGLVAGWGLGALLSAPPASAAPMGPEQEALPPPEDPCWGEIGTNGLMGPTCLANPTDPDPPEETPSPSPTPTGEEDGTADPNGGDNPAPQGTGSIPPVNIPEEGGGCSLQNYSNFSSHGYGLGYWGLALALAIRRLFGSAS